MTSCSNFQPPTPTLSTHSQTKDLLIYCSNDADAIKQCRCRKFVTRQVSFSLFCTTVAIPNIPFGYTVRRTQYDRLSQQQLGFLMSYWTSRYSTALARWQHKIFPPIIAVDFALPLIYDYNNIVVTIMPALNCCEC